MTANKPRLRWRQVFAYRAGVWSFEWEWVCASSRVRGFGPTKREAWLDWQKNCHTVTKVTQTAIGDCANKADNSLIATTDEEAPK